MSQNPTPQPDQSSQTATAQPASPSQSSAPPPISQPQSPTPQSPPRLRQRLQSLITQPGSVVLAGCMLLLVLATVILGLRSSPWWYVPFLILIALVLIVIIRVGYEQPWTGFGEYTSPAHLERTDFQRRKTLWDWLQLLIIPIVLAVGALGLGAFQNQENFNLSQAQFQAAATQYANNQNIAATQYANAQQLALENTFQTYLDRMTDLLTNQHVHDDTLQGADIRSLAAARTLTILPDLSPSRKATVLKFLHDAGLISRQTKDQHDKHIINPVVNLNGADFSGIDLNGLVLGGADLAFVNFKGANLMSAYLSSAYLPGADLTGAHLDGADLSFAQLFDQQSNQPPEIADLTGAHLDGANLTGADLIQAILTNADLSNANLTNADLSNANLTGATVTNADFTGVTWKNTTCPDGTNSDAVSPSSCNVG